MPCPLGPECEQSRDLSSEELWNLLKKRQNPDHKIMNKCADELERRLNINSILLHIPILGIFLGDCFPTDNLSSVLGTYNSERKLMEVADSHAIVAHGIAEWYREAHCPLCKKKTDSIRLLPCTAHSCCQDCAKKTPRSCPFCNRFYHEAQKLDVRLGTCSPSCVALDAHRKWRHQHYSGVDAADKTFPLVYTLGLGLIGLSIIGSRYSGNLMTKLNLSRFVVRR